MNRFVLTAAMIALLLGGTSGCATSPDPLMGSGHMPAYADGFRDGCESGRASQNPIAGRATKDTARFSSDAQYAEGWAAGNQKCAYVQMQSDAGGR